jgi:hypothetical protein
MLQCELRAHWEYKLDLDSDCVNHCRSLAVYFVYRSHVQLRVGDTWAFKDRANS